MDLTRRVRAGIAGILMGVAACSGGGGTSGGGGGVTPPPSKGVITANAPSVTPNPAVSGTSLSLGEGASVTSPGSIDSVVYYVDNGRIGVSPNNGSATATAPAAGSHTARADVYGTNVQTSPASSANTSFTTNAAAPSAQLQAQLTSTTVTDGNLDSVTATLNVQNGKPDSVVATLASGPRIGGIAGGTFPSTTFYPLQSDTAVVKGYYSAQNGSSPQTTVLKLPFSVIYNVEFVTGSLGTAPIGRVQASVNGQLITLPNDTTFKMAGGQVPVGITANQPGAYDFGEMYVNGNWYPLAPNMLTQKVTIGHHTVVDLDLISLNEPNYGGHAKQESDSIWMSPLDSMYHPTKIIPWSVYTIDSGWTAPGQTTPECMPMSAQDIAGAKAAVDTMNAQDVGTDGSRRQFTYAGGDPISAGKIIQLPNGLWRPVSGVVIECTAPPDAQSNVSSYDSQGFFDAYWARAGASANDWMGELEGFEDWVYNGQEGSDSNLSRNTQIGNGIVRGPLDIFMYNQPLRIAWQAGQNGYGLLKVPQPPQ